MTNIYLSEDDLEIEILIDDAPKTAEELGAWLTEAPLRVTHRPTGISAIGEGQGNQIKNKERALQLLKERLAKETQP